MSVANTYPMHYLFLLFHSYMEEESEFPRLLKLLSLLVINLGCSSSEYLAIYPSSHLFCLLVPSSHHQIVTARLSCCEEQYASVASCPCMLRKGALAPLWEEASTVLCPSMNHEG